MVIDELKKKVTFDSARIDPPKLTRALAKTVIYNWRTKTNDLLYVSSVKSNEGKIDLRKDGG